MKNACDSSVGRSLLDRGEGGVELAGQSRFLACRGVAVHRPLCTDLVYRPAHLAIRVPVLIFDLRARLRTRLLSFCLLRFSAEARLAIFVSPFSLQTPPRPPPLREPAHYRPLTTSATLQLIVRVPDADFPSRDREGANPPPRKFSCVGALDQTSPAYRACGNASSLARTSLKL